MLNLIITCAAVRQERIQSIEWIARTRDITVSPELACR